jgi:hypothetical protein
VAAAPAATGQSAADRSIRPFKAEVPQADLDDLRRRIRATRWPDKETVADRSQGIQLAKLQELVRYWGAEYDWRKVEARLNGLPQFVTTIDGVDIHFIHVRSRHPKALPLLITHGWPGSVVEQLKVIGPLTDPPSFGGRGEDAFDVVIPLDARLWFFEQADRHRLESGADRASMGRAHATPRVYAVRRSRRRLGLADFQRNGTPGSAGLARHPHQPARAIPPEVAAVLAVGGPAPGGLSDRERAAFEALDMFYKKHRGYAQMMGTRPQVIGQALSDSPAGLAAWMYDYNNGEPERLLARDDFLDDVTLYWLTNTAALVSAAVLGDCRPKRPALGRADDVRHLASRGHHGISRGDLSDPRDVGAARVSQSHLLSRGRQGRALRGLGGAAAPRRGAARRLQTLR